MTAPTLPVLEEGPSFAPKRGPRKPKVPNVWDGPVAELIVDENGYSASQLFSVDSLDDARAQRSLIRKAAKTAGRVVKVSFETIDGSDGRKVRFGVVPAKEKAAADESVAQAPAGEPVEAAPAPAPTDTPFQHNVDF